MLYENNKGANQSDQTSKIADLVSPICYLTLTSILKCKDRSLYQMIKSTCR